MRCRHGGLNIPDSPLQVMALHDVSSTDAAIIYSMEPVLGAGLAYVVLGERWGRMGWVGAALIIVSSLAAQIMGTEEEPAEKPVEAVAAAAVASVDKRVKSGRKR